MRRSISGLVSRRPSGQTHFYWTPTSSTARRGTSARPAAVRHGALLRIRNEYDCDQQIQLQARDITGGLRFSGDCHCTLLSSILRSNARCGRKNCRHRGPPGRSVRASRDLSWCHAAPRELARSAGAGSAGELAAGVEELAQRGSGRAGAEWRSWRSAGAGELARSGGAGAARELARSGGAGAARRSWRGAEELARSGGAGAERRSWRGAEELAQRGRAGAVCTGWAR
jgi:hypothetical protein